MKFKIRNCKKAVLIEYERSFLLYRRKTANENNNFLTVHFMTQIKVDKIFVEYASISTFFLID